MLNSCGIDAQLKRFGCAFSTAYTVESLEPGEIGIFFYDGNVYIKMLDTSEDTVEDEFGEVTTEHHIYLVFLNEK